MPYQVLEEQFMPDVHGDLVIAQVVLDTVNDESVAHAIASREQRRSVLAACKHGNTGLCVECEIAE